MSKDLGAAEWLDWIGEGAAKTARMLPGKVGAAMASVSLIGKAAAEAIRARGDTVEDVIGRIKTPRSVKLPWEDTSPETPSAKRDE